MRPLGWHFETHKYSTGFTLLEVLVVLTIASLISLVLMQGLGMVLNLRNSFGGQILDIDREVVKRNLMRQPLDGLVPDFEDGASIFSGEPARVSGLTTTPLLRRNGRPTPFALTLAFDPASSSNSLSYQEIEDEPITLSEWVGPEAKFKFLGIQTGWVEAWPPGQPQVFGVSQIITDIRPPQLPEMVYLDTQGLAEPPLAVAVTARRNRLPRDPPSFSGTAN
jgi:general secretion pathway protein J